MYEIYIELKFLSGFDNNLQLEQLSKTLKQIN